VTRRSGGRHALGRARWLLGAGYALVAGCASYSPHQGASLTAFDQREYALAADAIVVDRGLGPEVLAVPEFGLSKRVSERWDAGGRVYPLGLELHARHRLYAQQGYQLTLMPLFAASQVSATNADTNFAELGAGGVVLNGFEFTPALALCLGLRSQLRLGLNAVALREDFAAANWALLNGGSLALSWRMTPRHTLLPGVLVLFPYDLERSAWDYAIVQAGLGLSW